MKAAITLGLVSTIFLSGCAANLSSGKTFQSIEKPPAEKTKVYLIRDENIMAAKLPYMIVSTAKSDGKGEPAEKYEAKALVGKDMFVPILMDPGTYVFKTGMKTEVTLQSGKVTCLEVGAKFRGVTIYNVEEIVSQEDCKKTLDGKQEGVQLVEAMKLTGWIKDK